MPAASAGERRTSPIVHPIHIHHFSRQPRFAVATLRFHPLGLRHSTSTRCTYQLVLVLGPHLINTVPHVYDDTLRLAQGASSSHCIGCKLFSPLSSVSLSLLHSSLTFSQKDRRMLGLPLEFPDWHHLGNNDRASTQLGVHHHLTREARADRARREGDSGGAVPTQRGRTQEQKG